MKKIIKFLLVTIVLIPFIVLADGSGPVFTPYAAYVSDANGASLYTSSYENDNTVFKKTGEVLKYKTEVIVIDEHQVSKDDTYVNVILNGSKYDEDEESESLYVNRDKLALFKEEYTVDDLKKELKYLEENGYGEGESGRYEFEKSTMLIYSNEVPMYKGPSTKYAKKDTVLKKNDVVDYYASETTWVYVDNGSSSGWVNQEDMIYLTKNKPIWLLEDTETYDMLGSEEFKKKDFKIPKGEKFDNVFSTSYVEYGQEDEESEYYEFYRVVYNENEYFISDHNRIAIKGSEVGDNNSIVIAKETDAYDNVAGNKKTTIPANTKLESQYYCSIYDKNNEGWNTWVYVSYKDNNYWINDSKTAYYYEDKIMTITDTNYYDSLSGNVVGSLPSNIEFIDYYSYNGWYYVMINNGQYWINKDNTASYYYDDSCEKIEIEESLYDTVNGEKTGKTIPANTEICPRYYYYRYDSTNNKPITWLYIKNKKYEGWINAEDDELQTFTEVIESDLNETTEPNINKKPNTNSEPDVIVSNNKLSKKELIVIGSLSAVILALCTVVTILLVNKKKQQKQLEQSVEEQPVDSGNNNAEN